MTFRRKSISRRDFIKYSMAAGAAAALPWRMAMAQAVTGPYGVGSPNLTKFVDAIRGIGGAGIPLAGSDGTSTWGATHYKIGIAPFNDFLHSDFTNPAKAAYMGAGFPGTKLWGYYDLAHAGAQRHLGGVIVAFRNQPVQITFQNQLPPNHILPVDASVPQDAGHNRTAVHLHGGYVPWISDGGPFDWFDPNGGYGTSFLNNMTILGSPGVPGQAEYYYPNNQTSRLVWYHDHAYGITRLNAYAGVASAYVIADLAGDAAFDAANPGVPSALDLAAINSTFFYLVFQDKIFFPPNATIPANYGANAGPGDLFYAYLYDTALFGPLGVPSFGGGTPITPPIPSCVPEFFGDTILCNGTAYPVLEVEARPVRFRLLNACNARFLNPRLVSPAGTVFPDNTEPTNMLGPKFIQVGTEGGYLPQAVNLDGSTMAQLLLAPAERADIVIDFSKAKAGTEFLLYNDAPGPFPGGFAGFDYFPKNPKTPTSIPGYGPNTRTLLKIRIKAATSTVTPIPKKLNTAFGATNDPPLVTQTPGVPTPIPTSVTVNGVMYPVAKVRTLTLNEGFDKYGRLQQFLGTDTQVTGSVPGFFGRPYAEPPGPASPTEIVGHGTVEVWQLINTTADTHPIHFHLVNVQILYRQAVKTKGFTGTITVNPNGQPYAPDLNELGWKETVRMNPGEVTTVIMKFDLPSVPFTVPASPRTGGNEYVYHCHILEHEEHDMMRPLVVT